MSPPVLAAPRGDDISIRSEDSRLMCPRPHIAAFRSRLRGFPCRRSRSRPGDPRFSLHVRDESGPRAPTPHQAKSSSQSSDKPSGSGSTKRSTEVNGEQPVSLYLSRAVAWRDTGGVNELVSDDGCGP